MSQAPNAVVGKTFNWTWTAGPTANSTHQHTFHADGSMEWRVLDSKAEGKTGHEKKYAAVSVTPSIYAVSYLAESGYTITVILDFETSRIVGFASNDKEWYPLEGRFTEVPAAA